MAVTLNASTSSGLVQTADTSGTVEIQSNGTTRLTVASGGVTATNLTATGTFGGGVITAGTAVSASSTSVDFTSIPSWVKRITVMFQGVSTNGTSIPQIQIGSGSFVTTGYLGVGFIALNLFAPAISQNSTGFLTSGDCAATYTTHGSIVLSNITGNTWVINGILGQSDAARIQMCGGSLALGGTLDRVRITTVNGTDTFDAGTINILYEG